MFDFQLIGILLWRTIGEHIFCLYIIFVVFILYLTFNQKHILCVQCSIFNPIASNFFLVTNNVIKTWSYPKLIALLGFIYSLKIWRNLITFWIPPKIIPPLIIWGFISFLPISFINSKSLIVLLFSLKLWLNHLSSIGNKELQSSDSNL